MFIFSNLKCKVADTALHNNPTRTECILITIEIHIFKSEIHFIISDNIFWYS